MRCASNTLPLPVTTTHYITQASLAPVPSEWGKQAPLTNLRPSPTHPFTLIHTPPVMFVGLKKKSINSDLVAVSCGPLCEVVTSSEWESDLAPPPPPSCLLLARLSGLERSLCGSGGSVRPYRVVALGVGTWIERVLLPHVSEWRTLCAGASLFV